MTPQFPNLKKILLTLSILLIGTQAAFAQGGCRGKTVHLQTPAGWGNKIYIMWSGNFYDLPITDNGEWKTVTLPNTLSNDAANNAEIVFLSANEYYLPAGICSITSASVSCSQNAVTTGKFYCSDFGPDGTWIMPDPTNPAKSAVSKNPPNAYYFYFLPPNTPEWIVGVPYIEYKENGATKSEKMEPDEMCGWYKKVYFEKDPPEEGVLIVLDNNKQKVVDGGFAVIGIGGEDEGNSPTAFNLRQQFVNMQGGAGTIYFMAGGDGDGGYWATSRNPTEDRSRCSYNLAAIIYDTDASVNSSFFDYNGKGDLNPTGAPVDGAGISKGIVENTLVDSKMVFKTPKDGWTADNFRDAFKSTPGKNVVRCYDMPFERNKKTGLWEFDSNKLCSDGTMDLLDSCRHTNKKYLGGFFPPALQERGDGDYSQCPNCDHKRAAQGWVAYDTSKISQFCYDRGRLGTSKGPNIASCGAAIDGEGYFKNGDDTPTNIWTWNDDRDNRIAAGLIGTGPTINGNGWSNKTMLKNELFCFESAPAKFTYEAGQEFFFSGDDDIWIFINNKLAIDLGGTHLAAPGYVNLDAAASTLGLKPDSIYPMNVFFCDRRTTMSNVRITTNMFFQQTDNLYSTKGSNAENGTNTLCYVTGGGGGSCIDVMKGTVGGKADTLCGDKLPKDLNTKYYLVNSRGEFLLDIGSPECVDKGNSVITCYGGITIDLIHNGVDVNAGAFYGFSGNQKVYARPSGFSKLMANFTPGSDIIVVWGDVYGNNSLIRKFPHNTNEVNVVAGRMVPIGFAKGGERTGGGFDVNMEAQGGSPGSTFSIAQAGLTDPTVPGSQLELYYDTAGQDRVPVSEIQQIPGNGLLVLYAKGSYRADGDAKYTVSASKENSITLNVKLPQIKFAGTNNVPLTNPTGGYCGNDQKACGTSLAKRNLQEASKMGDYLGTEHERTIVAIDPVTTGPYGTTATPAICASCNFNLNFNAVAKRISTNEDVLTMGLDANLMQVNGLTLSEGKGNIVFSGIADAQGDTMVFLTMRGESRSPDHRATWDSLVFIEPPVPRPEIVQMYDRNGDGIADSLYIKYNKEFVDDDKGRACEKLPNAIEVLWDVRASKPVTVAHSSATQNSSGQYTIPKASCDANMQHWAQYMKGAKDVIELTGIFSEGIQTRPYEIGGKGIIRSWATFTDVATTVHIPNPGKIEDRVPAVIVDARYKAGTRKDCGVTAANKCADEIVLTFSEAVKPADESVDAVKVKYGFQYCLVEDGNRVTECQFETNRTSPPADEHFRVYNTNPNDEPASFLWRKGGQLPNNTTGDSVVTIKYNRFNDKNTSERSLTPMPKDYVKFTNVGKGDGPLYTDLSGNLPNLKEQGKNIEGEKPFGKEPIRIADANPGDKKEDIAAKIKDKNQNGGNPYDIGNAVDEWYQVGKPGKSGAIDFMPVPNGSTPEDVKKYYPSTVGIVFKPDIASMVDALEKKKTGNAVKIDPGNIVLIAKANIHTNLGNYVVDREFFVSCNDPRFKIDGAGDCRSNQSEIYLAWNLRDKKDRLAGSGAYIEVYDFKWRVLKEPPKDAKDLNGAKKGKAYSTDKGDDPFDKSNSIEMFGVRRTK